MRFAFGRRSWALYVLTVGLLSVLAYVVAYWAATEPPPPAPTDGSGGSAIDKSAIQPSPPVYDTVSPLKQDH